MMNLKQIALKLQVMLVLVVLMTIVVAAVQSAVYLSLNYEALRKTPGQPIIQAVNLGTIGLLSALNDPISEKKTYLPGDPFEVIRIARLINFHIGNLNANAYEKAWLEKAGFYEYVHTVQPWANKVMSIAKQDLGREIDAHCFEKGSVSCPLSEKAAREINKVGSGAQLAHVISAVSTFQIAINQYVIYTGSPVSEELLFKAHPRIFGALQLAVEDVISAQIHSHYLNF